MKNRSMHPAQACAWTAAFLLASPILLARETGDPEKLPAAEIARSATASEAFNKLAELLKSGDVETAISLMSERARSEYISESMMFVADLLTEQDVFPETLGDGSKSADALAAIGFDTLELPQWFTAASGSSPSDEQWDALDEQLMDLVKKADDREKALLSLYLLTESIEPGDFSGKIVAPPGDSEPTAERVWVEYTTEGKADIIPLLFSESEGRGWQYAGWDWDAMDAEKRRFVEHENLTIAGKTHDGKEIELSDYLGKVVLIDFWGTW